MYPSSQSINTNKLQSYISLSSPKLKPSSNPIISSIQKAMSFQQQRFQQINHSCTTLQTYITTLQQTLDKLQQKLSQLNQSQSTETIFNLKNKQNQFIIHQLKDKIHKLSSNQLTYQIEIKHLKKELDIMKKEYDTNKKSEKDKLIEIVENTKMKQLQNNKSKQQQINKLKQQSLNMQKIIKSKQLQIQQLNKKLSKSMKMSNNNNNSQQKGLQQLSYSSSISKIQKKRRQKQEDYKLLEGKLLQLQRQFQVKVTSLHQQVRDKNQQIKEKTMTIKELQQKLYNKQKQLDMMNNNNNNNNTLQQKQPSMTLTFNPSRQSLSSPITNPSHYQLQLKLSHQQNLYKQLQQQYTTHLTTANNLQIQLHQQIHSQKITLQEQKQKHKIQTKSILQALHSLATHINKRTFNYFDNNVIKVIEELKNIYNKQKQKYQKSINIYKQIQQQLNNQITIQQKDNKKTKTQTQLLKQQISTLKQQLFKYQTLKQKQRKLKRQNSSQISQISENQTKRSSLNGSLGQITNPKSQTPSLIEEKYKTLIDSLRQQIQQKEQHITELQNLQSIDFEKSKQKILNIQSQLADSRNQIKKQQRQIRDLKQKLNQHTKQTDKYKISIQQNKQKYQKQKQLTQTQYQQKIKNLQEKITKLKDQNQLIDSKCQQKVMKYNKLKTKVQKLQLYNNQTQKRKDSQIQQLIKKNQQIKMDCKLMQEKLNIAQTLQFNTSGNTEDENAVKTTFGYNRDLIEQIQMERDRILQQYESKRRDYLKLKQTSDKLQEQNKNLEQKIVKFEQQRLKRDQQKQDIKIQRQNLIQQNQRIVNKLSQQKQSLSLQVFDLKKQLSKIKDDNQSLRRQIQKIQEQITNKSKQQYQYLKKQLQSQLQLKKKKEKQEQALVYRIKQLKQQNQKIKKQLLQKTKAIQSKWMQKFKQKSTSYHQQINKLKDQHNRKLKDMQQKLSQSKTREENLVNIINYKNLSVSGTVRESIRGEEQEYQEGREEMNKQLIEDEVEHVQEYNFMAKHHKVETFEQQTQTDDRRQTFGLSQLEHVQIVPYLKIEKQLTLQKLQAIQIHPIIQSIKQAIKQPSIEQQTNVNIFQNKQQLLLLLKQKYPQLIECLRLQNQVQKEQLKKQIQVQKVDFGTNTEQHKRLSIKKTDIIPHSLTENRQSINQRDSHKQRLNINQRESINQRQSINILKSTVKGSSFLLQGQFLAGSGSHELSRSSVQQTPITDSDFINIHTSPREKFNPQSNKVQQINLFVNLKPSNLNLQIDEDNLDDNFEICQQGESINVGQTALNLQIKQIFNKLREQLQKVFNGEDISLSMIKILPRQLQDDYNEFIGYVKQKIMQIKNENQLSFIMAEVGDSPQQLDEQLDSQLQSFADKKVTEDVFAYKKLVQQKQALITSLMNEMTMQQNTINQMTTQQQQVQQQHENRFMNQCNIYKKQIKQLKNRVDTLQMNFQSLKNIFKNTMEIWVDQIENQDDLRDNFTIYKSIAKLNQLQSTRLNYYIFRYKEIKNITD